MVKFIPVDPDDIVKTKQGHRGRVSYPILKGFLESGHYIAKIDRTGMQQSLQTLYTILRQYARNHSMPIKVFSHQGSLCLMRLDIDEKGNEIPDWEQKELMQEIEKAPKMDASTVSKNFEKEKDQVTK